MAHVCQVSMKTCLQSTESTGKLGMMVCTCSPRARDAQADDPWNSLDSDTVYLKSFRLIRNPTLRNKANSS